VKCFYKNERKKKLWCGDMALKEAFPHLYGIAYAKDAHLKLYGGTNQWNVSFARAIHD
jgi:hypothetical protein